MLIEAIHNEETRVAVIDESSRLVDFDYESSVKKSIKGNVYLGKIVRIEPSLQAAFVDYGGNRHGFLAYSEIHPDYFRIPVEDRPAEEEESVAALEVQEAAAVEGEGDASAVDAEAETDVEASSAEDAADVDAEVEDKAEEEVVEEKGTSHAQLLKKYRIQEVIRSRQIVLVQIVKDERGNKGAALTTFVSLPGRYCVLMPNAAGVGGVSRKITNTTDRRRLKDLIQDLNLPQGMALIVRTAGMDRSKTEIKRDYRYLINLWAEIREKTLSAVAPQLVYEEADLVNRAIRDMYTRDIDEILVEGEDAYKQAKTVMKKIVPSHAKKVQRFKDPDASLFFKHSVERQINEIFKPQVKLRSGGYLVIHPTEALVSIDVNSGKATRERHIDSTALNTNLEAAEEVARQVRLRDLSGLVVVDFIDMADNRHNMQVEKRLRENMQTDRARIQIGRISMFGLLEMSRQRLRPSIFERSSHVCLACAGTGNVRTPAALAVQLLRVLEEECTQSTPSHLNVFVSAPTAFYLLNEKRSVLSEIETRFNVQLRLEQDPKYVNGFCLRGEDGAVILSTDEADYEGTEKQAQPSKNNANRSQKPKRREPRAAESDENSGGDRAASKRNRRGRDQNKRSDKERTDKDRSEKERADKERPEKERAEQEALVIDAQSESPQTESAAPKTEGDGESRASREGGRSQRRNRPNRRRRDRGKEGNDQHRGGHQSATEGERKDGDAKERERQESGRQDKEGERREKSAPRKQSAATPAAAEGDATSEGESGPKRSGGRKKGWWQRLIDS